MSHDKPMPAHRFWGALVVSRLVNKPPLNLVEVGPNEVVLHRFLRSSETVRRASVARVEIRRGRRPFDWTSYVAFIDVRGKRIGELFRPVRVQRVRQALLDHGWPVSSTG